MLIDIRDPDTYRAAHLPGAVNVPEVFFYLSQSTAEGLLELQRNFQALFSKAGVTHEKAAIFYDDNPATRYGASCRGYWLTTYLGHRRAGILDGGIRAWEKAGLPVQSGIVTPGPTAFATRPDPTIMATREDVLKALNDPAVTLLDNRDTGEWLGLTSSPYGVDFAPRKGRIPGAKWIEWYEFMDRSRGVPGFRSSQTVREICAQQGIFPDSDIIIYCFKGARASHTYVALKEAGFTKIRIYFASWNEWARDPALPIEEGFPKNRLTV